MPRNGSGSYSLPAGNPVTTGTTISSTWANTTLNDLATALTTSIASDGQTTPTANLPMGGFKLTGLAAGTATGNSVRYEQTILVNGVNAFTADQSMGGFKLTNLAAGVAVSDAARVSQIQNGSFTSLTAVAGTNTVTATATPTPAAYVVGQVFEGVAAATNTGATTLNISSLGAGAVQVAGSALVGGEFQANAPFRVYVSAVTPVFQIIANGSPIPSVNAGDVPVVSAAGSLRNASATNSPINCTLTASQNGTVLTVALKARDGTDPSATNPLLIPFRSATATTADYTWRAVTAANSISTTVGGTFGVANSVAFRLWIVAFDDGGTVRLALINCLTTVAGAGAGRDVTSLYQLGQDPIASATQIGAGSTSAGVFYSAGAAVTSKAYRVLGWILYNSGLATAGTFGVNQSALHIQSVGDPLPGQSIQMQRNDTGAMTTGATVLPYDDSIPQITEGDQYMTQAITPTSSANVLSVTHAGLYHNAGNENTSLALFQDATSNALAAVAQTLAAAGGTVLHANMRILSSTTSSTTFRARVGGTASTVTFNGVGGVRRFALTARSYMEAEEIMA